MSAAARCRYYQQPCNGPGTSSLSMFGPECKGPVDLSAVKKTQAQTSETKATTSETKPAAPETEREEVKTMPAGIPIPVWACPECGTEGKLYASKNYDWRRCAKCFKRASNAAYRKTASKPASAPKPAAAPKEPRPDQIAQQRPAQAAPAPVSRPGKPADQPHPNVVIRVVCHDLMDVRRVLAATDGLSVHVGLEA